MMVCVLQRLVLAFSFTFSIIAAASDFPIIDLNVIRSTESIGESSRYLLDESGDLTFSQLSNDTEKQWQQSSSETLSFGYSKSAVWVKFDLFNSGIDTDWFLDVAYPVLDNVDIYVQYTDKIDSYHLGDRTNFNDRPVNHRNFVVPIILQRNKSATVMLRVSSGTSLQIPLSLWKQSDLHDSEQSSLLWQGLYFGLILVMTFYNLCLYYYTRENNYIYYALVFGSFVLFQATLDGFSYQFLWPFSPEWNEHALPVFLGLVLLSESIFVRSFLNLRTRSPRVATSLRVAATVSGLIILLSAVIPYRISIMLLIILALPINITGLIFGFKHWLEGDDSAKLFTIAWLGTLTGAVALSLSKLGVIERNIFSEHALQIGTAVSVLWLSFALGEYIAQQARERQKEKEKALKYALALAQEREEKLDAQDTLLKTQQQANVNLESEVKQRTSQLEKTMLELEDANSKLKHISNLDELTGIYNRRFFNQKFEAEFKRAQRTKKPLAVIMVDIDHFKDVNDNYGHLVGDVCLKSVAKVLKHNVTRPQDTLARFGGEEFIVVLPGTPLKGAMYVADNLLKGVESEVVNFEDLSISTTVSIGVAVICPSVGDNPDEVVAKADAALYQAKETGRNRICISPDK